MMSEQGEQGGIAVRLADLQESVDRLEGEIANENRLRGLRIAKTERTTRWAVRAAFIGILVGVLALVAAGLGIRSAHDAHASAKTAQAAADKAQRALDASKAATQDARVNSCLQANRAQFQEIDAQIVQSHNFVNLLATASGKPITPPEQVIIDRVNQQQDDLIRKGHPQRDCSPEGIAKYLSNPKK